MCNCTVVLQQINECIEEWIKEWVYEIKSKLNHELLWDKYINEWIL